MKERQLKYGCNPNQTPARIYSENELPIEILSGNPGYINLLDALSGYQLVSELKKITGLASAASFKHVSPAGAAIGNSLSDVERKVFFTKSLELSSIAIAYARARGTDRMCSFGDYIALSDECDESCARLIRSEVSDGIIAPSYTKEAIEILSKKRNGSYNIVSIDKNYTPKEIETRTVYGITFEQRRNDIEINENMLKNIVTENKVLPKNAAQDLLISLVTLKYTQSNSVCYVKNGQTIGVGAGQQSRIHCTRLAGDKADTFNLRFHEKVIDLPFLDNLSRPDRDTIIDLYISNDSSYIEKYWDRYFYKKPTPLSKKEKKEYISNIRGVSLGSDAFFPFGDNVERAHMSGVEYIVQAGGSVRDDKVIEAANSHDMVMVFCGTRFFHH